MGGPLEVPLPNGAGASALARSHIDRWWDGRRGDREALQLVVTELVNNAVLHGRPPIGLRVGVFEGALVVWVSDGGGERPALRDGSPTMIGGLGLRMVEALSTDWGVDSDTERTTVWAQMPAVANVK
jgi:anti-sigma regulatory factor (Ser/Thr protein kinase)